MTLGGAQSPAAGARLSVVIPVLDDADLLFACLAALEAQKVKVDEIIVVDNGCTDDSVAVALAAGSRVVEEERKGIPAAASAGLDAATGDLLARLDSDSVPPPDWSERVIRSFESSPELAVLTGPGDFYDAGPVLARIGRVFYMDGYFRSVKPLLGQPPAFGSNFAMRASVWRGIRAAIHDDRDDVHDDMDLSFQLAPGMITRFDPDLRMGISARPLRSASGMVRRFYRAFVTIGLNWSERGPLERLAERRSWNRRSRERPAALENR